MKRSIENILLFIKKYKDTIILIVLATSLSVAFTLIIILFFNTDMLGNVSNFLQLVTVVFAVLAWNNTRIILERRKNSIVDINGSDLILMISLSSNVTGTVKKYLESTGVDALDRRPIETIDNTDTLSSPTNEYMTLSIPPEISGALLINKLQDMPLDKEGINDYLTELRNCMSIVSKSVEASGNVERVHIFISGTVEISAFIMPYFVNKKTVMMYKFNKGNGEGNNSYIPMGVVENR